ncbi:MAG: nucleoside-diphosphate sugar epimerase/dehydratase [Parvibaculum sp.]
MASENDKPDRTFSAWLNARRAIVIFLFDVFLAAISFPLTLFLRLGDDGFIASLQLVGLSTLAFTAIAALVIWRSNLQRIPWRYVSVDDALLLARTALFCNLGFLVVMFLTSRLNGVPRSSVLIDTIVLTMLFVGARLIARLWHEKQLGLIQGTLANENIVPVILIGATDESDAFIRKMARDPSARYRVLGIVTTNNNPVGARIRGVKVLGSLDHLQRITLEYRSILKGLIVADDNLRGDPIRALLDFAQEQGVRLDRLPEMSRLVKASSTEIDVRPIDVEDLLSRPQASLDREGMAALIGDRRVLITGAGGSIGSELVRQIAGFSPKHIALFDNSEFNLYEIDRQVTETFPDLSCAAIVGNVREADLVERVFAAEQPDIVFHAAALKHVPLLESQPSQAVLTNVMGTRNIADAAVRHNVTSMVMISTDKATHPVSVMGGSKRIAETYCQLLDVESRKRNHTRFVTVRFGNVLGSAGSVIPLFQKQLQRGGPLTVTHPDMTRFFMTIREAVELVLQAATLRDELLDKGGAIVVLDMGRPVKIIDMARQMIKLAGLVPDEDIEIKITGLRPGERLYEDLFNANEEILPTSHKELMAAIATPRDGELAKSKMGELVEAAKQGDDAAVIKLMHEILPDFRTVKEADAEARNLIGSV